MSEDAWLTLLAHGMSQRWAGVAAVLLSYALLCAWVARRQGRLQRQRLHERASLAAGLGGEGAGAAPAGAIWVVYASQSGQAEALAWQSAHALHEAGCATQVRSLSQWGEVLAQMTAQVTPQGPQPPATRVLFIVSTHGEGDPPDNALPFVQRCMSAPTAPTLQPLHYGLLALGDRDYHHFCAFGRRLDAWLQGQGAAPMFDRIEVHQGDPAAVQAWRQQLGRLAGTSDLPDWQAAPDFQPWRLVAQRCLNPGSPGQPVYHLALVPVQGQLPDWEAGDLVQIQAPEPGQRPREYSIANVSGEGNLQLLVRQHVQPDGTLGLVSGWLTASATATTTIPLRLRAHPNFRMGGNADRPLILIGNGTGLAGLRAHLKARAQALAQAHVPAPARCVWLLFGERTRAHDQFYADEMLAWRTSGLLSQVDGVFSRDEPEAPYVQHRLRERAALLRSWVTQGAAIYVCGSLQGMASGVDAALREVLGEVEVDELMRVGRLRRDVY